MDDSQKAALATELAKPQYQELMTAQRYPEIADMLNARPQVDNPTPRPNRPKMITWVQFLDALSNADTLKLYTYPGLAADLRAALAANDRTSTIAIWKGLKTALTATSVTAVEALANATEADPTYQAKIPGASVADTLGLGAVKPADVQEAEQAK